MDDPPYSSTDPIYSRNNGLRPRGNGASATHALFVAVMHPIHGGRIVVRCYWQRCGISFNYRLLLPYEEVYFMSRKTRHSIAWCGDYINTYLFRQLWQHNVINKKEWKNVYLATNSTTKSGNTVMNYWHYCMTSVYTTWSLGNFDIGNSFTLRVIAPIVFRLSTI